jgi:general secretion pathway protein G
MATLKKSARDGFTLIEILIAIAIVGLMLAIVGPAVYRRFAGATESAAKNQLAAFKQAIGMYYIDLARYPDKLSDLVRKPADPKLAEKWKGPYLEVDEIPDDPWGSTYQYKRTPGERHPYELYSYGSEEGRATPKEKWIQVWK